MANLTIGTASAAPGTKAKGAIVAGTHPGGASFEIPLTIIHGAKPGPVLWLNACIHGDEPQGTLAIVELIRDLDPMQLKGSVVCVPAMNVPAFEASKRGNPLDMFAFDMNRIYPGNPQGRYTERLAWAHKTALAQFADMEISVHSGGDHSYLGATIFASPTDAGRELAQAMGKGWFLHLANPHPKGSPMAELYEQGKPAISIELGGASHCMPGDFRADAGAINKAFWNVLYHYGMVEGTPEYEPKWLTGEQVAVLTGASGLFVGEKDFQFMVPTKKDQVFARIYDLYGEELEVIKAPCDGIPFGLRTTPATHAGDWAIFFAKLDGEVTQLVHPKHSL